MAVYSGGDVDNEMPLYSAKRETFEEVHIDQINEGSLKNYLIFLILLYPRKEENSMLKVKMKRLLSIILAFTLCIGIVNPVYASDNNFVNKEMAYLIAVNFALGNTKEFIQTDLEGDLAAHGIEYIEEGYPDEFIVYEIV